MTIPTPVLPIAIPANATLTLRRELGTYTIDERSGNEIPDIETIEVSASLTKDLYQNRIAENVGADLQSIYLIGYILDPPDDISDFELDGIAVLRLTDQATGNILLGEFEFHYVPTPFGSTLSTIGIPIRGIYRIVENVEAAGAKRLAGTIEAIAQLNALATLELFLSGTAEAAAVISGQLTEIQNLIGTIAATGTYTGDLVVGQAEAISGTIEAVGTLAGNAVVEKRLAGSINSNGAYSANASIIKSLSGTIASIGSTTGAIAVSKTLSGTIVSTGTYAGIASLELRLSGLINASGSYEGNLTAGSTLKGTIAATGTYAVDASISKLLSGDIDTVGTFSAALTTEKRLAGIIDCDATNNGSLSITKSLAGTIESSGVLAASPSVEKQLTGAIESTGNYTVNLSIDKTLAGTINGIGIYEGDLSIAGALKGTIATTGSCAANLTTSLLARDTFTTGSNGDEISDRQPEYGTWFRSTGTSGGSVVLTNETRARQEKSGSGFEFQNYTIASAPNRRHLVSATIYYPGSVSNYTTGAATCIQDGQNAYYAVLYHRNSGQFRLVKREPGNIEVTLGSISSSLSVGGFANVSIEFNDNPRVIIARLNGSIFATSTDTTISTSDSFVGIRFTADSGAATTNTFGLHLDNFESRLIPVELSGTIESQGTVVGSVTQVKTLTGTIEIAGVCNATLTTEKQFAGTIESTGIIAGTLGAIKLLTGTITSTATQTGNLSTVKKLLGAINSSGTYSGNASVDKKLSGVASETGTIAGDAATTKSLTGTVEASGVYSGNLTVESEGFEPSLDFSNADNSQYVPLL